MQTNNTPVTRRRLRDAVSIASLRFAAMVTMLFVGALFWAGVAVGVLRLVDWVAGWF